jgi:hypothetical protein
LITITRRGARRLRAVFRRRALGIHPRGTIPPLVLHAEGDRPSRQSFGVGLVRFRLTPETASLSVGDPNGRHQLSPIPWTRLASNRMPSDESDKAPSEVPSLSASLTPIHLFLPRINEMIKANVGLSRKLSANFNSTGFSLNLEGEILATLDDPEAVIERIRERYNVAEEALDRQIADNQSNDAIARHESEDPSPHAANGQNTNGSQSPNGNPNGKPLVGDPATNKQVQFLQTLAKRNKLFGARLASVIGDITGRRCSPYDLTKKEAGQVIDQLSGAETESNSPRR